MEYRISDIAKMMNVNVSTLRYYEKEGLLPQIKRINGIRVFNDEDFKWLRILHCLKVTGMPLKEIRKYMELSQKGDETLHERQAMILQQKAKIVSQIALLEQNLKEIAFKEWYYETAIAAGSEKIHANRSCAPTLEPEEIPDETKEEIVC